MSTPSLSLASILSSATPAILNNVAAPLAAAAQLICLGHTGSSPSHATELVAAFTAATAVTAFVANVANFVLVVTMAKVGRALGAKQWAALSATVLSALAVATCTGAMCALLLLACSSPVLSAFSLPAAAREQAVAFWPYAVARLPPLLLLKSATGVLVGYQRLRLASLLSTLLALADAAAFYAILQPLQLGLPAAGLAVAITCSVAALVALAAVIALPPPEACGEVRLCACRSARTSSPSSTPGLEIDSAGILELACDSVNVLLRSLLLSGSVLAITVASSPLGAAALSAHAIILQLWMITSYVVDGFADVGTMIGSRLLGRGQAHLMRPLTLKLAAIGLATGLLASTLLTIYQDPIASVFTRDVATRAALLPIWPLLGALQPINSLVFVYDGLLYATQSFVFIRNALGLGVCLVFVPGLALAVTAHSLSAIWTAKACLNIWRCGSALFRIHVQLWPLWTPPSDTLPDSRTSSPKSPARVDISPSISPSISPDMFCCLKRRAQGQVLL